MQIIGFSLKIQPLFWAKAQFLFGVSIPDLKVGASEKAEIFRFAQYDKASG
jgi:hypothetical protein